MKTAHLEVLVEELSTEAALSLLLPKIVPDLSFKIYSHQGKADLLAKLSNRLRGYASWLPRDWRIIVVADRDDDDCAELKAQLEKAAADASFATRSTSRRTPYVLVNRLAVEELEAWYFGDWEAVRAAYPEVPATVSSKARFRAPDEIKGGTWEAFERVLQQAGYFSGGLRKIEAARAVAEHMCPFRNISPSFRVLRDAIAEMVA